MTTLVTRLVTIGFVATAVVVGTAGAASAKGASVVTISGPGLAQPIRLDQVSGPAAPNPNDLATATGALLVASGASHASVVAERPAGRLGPRYRVTYEILTGPNETKSLVQFVYPFARAGFVTHTPAGQRVFDKRTRSGWYVSTPRAGVGAMTSDAATALVIAVGVPDHTRA